MQITYLDMEHLVATFIQRYFDLSKPLLLGLSGGPDSIALLYMLLKSGVHLGVAHVDHGWREESEDEARQLALLIKKLKLPFHLKTLKKQEMRGNLEAACRNERHVFFKTLCEEQGYQAVLLGHQSGDVAETVLKRFFEGVSLPYLAGLREVVDIDGLKIGRPLLSVSKRQILEWLEENSIPFFVDNTNANTHFLRARFRLETIPYLSKTFGKEIEPALLRLNKESIELKEFFESHLQHFLSAIEITPLGIALDLSGGVPQTQFELKYLIHRFCEAANLFLPNNLIETTARLLLNNTANKEISAQKKVLYVDRRNLYCVWKPLQASYQKLPIQEGEFQLGGWCVSIHKTVAPGNRFCSHWKDFWNGQAEVYLPAEEHLFLGAPRLNAPYPGKSPLKKWWSDAKVPAFFRNSIPVVWQKEVIKHELLTGRTNDNFFSDKSCFHLKFYWQGYE